jgi:sporulation protein YlmC with PRC-barrel domain
MKKHLIRIVTCCATFAALAVQAQTSPGTTVDQTPGTPGTGTANPPATSSQWENKLGATGRMGQRELRGSKLMGAEVKTTQGESLGKFEDVIINPTSGRVEFAIISYAQTGTTGTAAGTPGTPNSAAASGSATGEKLVPVPWFLLRPQSMSGYGTPGATASTTSNEQPPTFVFSGDKSRLDNAPSFERNNWPEMTQPEWRQRIFAHFGMRSGPSTGGATTPGGTDTSTGTSTTPPPTQPTAPDQANPPKR